MTKRQRKKAWTKWRRLISEQARSGQSVTAFCRERGLCRPSFLRVEETAARRPRGEIPGSATGGGLRQRRPGTRALKSGCRMAGAWWWGEDSMRNMCGRCWRWWRQRGDRAAKFAGDGSRAGSADLDGQRSDGYALWIRSAGGTGESGHWGEPAKWPSVCVPFAARRSVEDSGMGPGRLRTVVQAAGTWGFQTAASGTGRAIGGIACQRAGDDSGWDRCFEAEARAALRTRCAKQRIRKS